MAPCRGVTRGVTRTWRGEERRRIESRCQVPFVGDQRKPACFKRVRVSASGFPGKMIWTSIVLDIIDDAECWRRRRFPGSSHLELFPSEQDVV